MKAKFIICGVAVVSGLALGAVATQSCAKAKAAQLNSPNGKIEVNVGCEKGRPFYTVKRNNEAVVDTSFLAIEFKEGVVGHNATLRSVDKTSLDETWKPVWGEESEIRNNYNGAVYHFAEEGELPVEFDVEFRVFDDGVGFRYLFAEQAPISEAVIMEERSEFNLPQDCKTWSIPWTTNFYEGLWKPQLLSKLDTVCTPVTMKVKEDLYMTIHEAALTDYAEMNLAVSKDGNPTKMVSYLTPLSTGEKVHTSGAFSTPWRTVIIADNAGDLMLSRLMLNLNEPCKIEDTSWIEPGRYIGIWWGMHLKDYTWELEGSDKHGATTENTKRYIDFAADNGFSAVLVEGWNKTWAGDWSANGEQFSFTEPYPDYDLEGLAEYARSKGVRLIGHNETGGWATNYENQMDSAFALYQKLGINAIKTGYVNPLLDNKELHGSQYGVRHYRKVIENAARHHIMVDNHEPVMPTGLQRTYPNLMTQEGVRGGEWDAWSVDGGNPPEHVVTLPFTRGLAGPMDYTPGTFNYDNPAHPGTHPRSTIAKQLAMSLILYSPLQMAADKIENYKDRPEFEFLTKCPTTWDKTLVPEAEIGEYVTVARKAKDSGDWYVASMTGNRSRSTDLKLDFLEPGAKYIAKIFADGEGAHGENNPYPVSITNVEVNSDSVLHLDMAHSGGAAVIITKNDKRHCRE